MRRRGSSSRSSSSRSSGSRRRRRRRHQTPQPATGACQPEQAMSKRFVSLTCTCTPHAL